MMSMHTIPPLYKLAMAGSVEEGISPMPTEDRITVQQKTGEKVAQ